MRVLKLVALLCALTLAGCAAVEPFIECVFRCDSMMVFYDEQGNVIGLQEVHNEVPCIAGVTESATTAWEPCNWDDEKEWKDKRSMLGVPLEVCVTCLTGETVCPPWIPHSDAQLGAGLTMDPSAAAGTLVRFAYPERVSGAQWAHALKYLTLGSIYMVDYTCGSGASSCVVLVEVPHQSFSTEMFAPVSQARE